MIAAVDRFLAGAFGDHNLDQTRADAIVIAEELADRYRQAKKNLAAGPRRAWALEQARLPIATAELTSDTEVFESADDLVMPGDAYDQIAAARADDAALRARLLADAATQHDQLAVTRK